MTLFAPLALAALAVPVAIYVVHWLFGTRRRMRVPAIFLWAELPGASMGRTRRRLPPFSWLLALQLIAAALLVGALARPGVPAEPPRHMALILDASASMQSTDVSPTRFAAARQAALDRLDALSATDLVSVIRAGSQATLLDSGTPASVRASLQAAQPGQTAPAIREALALASTRIAATPDREGRIVLFTDGAWSQPDPVGLLSAPVEVIPTGGGSNNQAITRLVVRMDPTGYGQTAFVEVANESDRPAQVQMQMTADDAPIDERTVDIAARALARLSIPLPVDAHHIVVGLLGKDSLPLDDVLSTTAPGGPPRSVDLLGNVSDGLQRAIESIPSMQIRKADASTPPDLSVLAGVLPARLPAGPLLLVDPPQNSARLLGVGLGSGNRVEPSHPLLDGLDLQALQDEAPSIGGVPGWAHVVLGTRTGPLIMEGRLEGHPTVSLTFDPAVSGLEKSLAFPLLISNATAFLLSEADASTIQPATPSNEAFDPAESDIAPRQLPTFQSSAPVAGALGVTPREIWPWVAALATGLLIVEWLVFARRG
jgi:hypothetical protein